MTAKRDLKRRIRQRQARTGESYMTARRRVLDNASDTNATTVAEEPRATGAVPVVEMIDITEQAAQLGLRCRIRISQHLSDQAGSANVLARLHEVIEKTADDPSMARLRTLAQTGRPDAGARQVRRFQIESLRRFFQRARAGLGGASDDGSMLALPVAGPDGIIPVVCSIWRSDGSLLLNLLDDKDLGILDNASATNEALTIARAPDLGAAEQRGLHLIFGSKRYAISKEQFVIGRKTTCDLQIKDGNISRKHAAVIRHNGTFYIKDLGSENGILYKGMRIDNKRIDEGDVFHVCDYELRFTYLETD